MTCAWLASYQLFGAPWKRDQIHFFPAPDAAAAPTKKRATRFSPTVETVPASISAAPPIPHNPYRITTPMVCAIVNPACAAMDRLHVTHITFVRLVLPCTQSNQGWDQMNEISASLRFFLLHLTRLDNAAKWLPWHEDDLLNLPYGRDRMVPPSHKAVLQDYSENGAFTAQGSARILRIRVGHSVAPSMLTGAQFQARLRSKGITLTVCRIQSADEQLLGHMLGSHPDIFKPTDWHEAHSLVPSIAAVGDFEFRSGYFDVDPEPEDKRSNKSPRVIQVWTSLAGARPLRNALSTLYSSSSKNTAPLPMGLRMRFLPNVGHSRLIVTSEDRIMAKKEGRSKQRKFLEKMVVSHNYTIIGLRYPLDEYGGITLHDAVSALVPRDDPTSPLFSAVEDMGTKVAFLYRRDRSVEALTVIPALPLVLAHLIGPNIWPYWGTSATVPRFPRSWMDLSPPAAPSTLDPYTVKFLEELRRPAAIKVMGSISPIISWSDHKEGWKRVKERTSASADSPSFSHYKVCATDSILGKFDCALRSLPPTYGFSPVDGNRLPTSPS